MIRRLFRPQPRSHRIGPLAAGMMAILAAAVLAAAGLALAGYDPAAAGRALVSGAFGSWERFASITWCVRPRSS